MVEAPDYLTLYQTQLQGDFYGADYYRHPQSEIDSAIIYDDGDDKRTMAALLATSFGPRRCLEVGCATGLLIKALRGYGIEAEGFDFSRWCVDHGHPSVREWLRVGDVLEPLPAGRSFDLILALDILEHLPPQRVSLALVHLAAGLSAGGLLFAVIPAYGPNRFGPEMFPLQYEGWRRDALLGRPFLDLPLDDRGRPHLGHLTHATIDWWERAFRRAGLARLGPVERLLHRRYDALLQPARRSFFLFAKAAGLRRWRSGRRLRGRIAAMPGLPRGFWNWERWGPDLWMRWTTQRAWEPVEVAGRDRLELDAICNHPDIAILPVRVRFAIDGGAEVALEVRDHDWHRVEVPLPRRRFAGLAIETGRTWCPEPDAAQAARRELGVGIAHPRAGRRRP